MIDAAALDRAEGLIRDAVQKGARILCGGKRLGPCMEPTLLESVPRNAQLATEEAFAPIASIQTFADIQEGLAAINDSPYGLQAGIFTQNLDLALHAFESIDVGAVLINQVPTWRVEHLPYGGSKHSGYGREGVRAAMREMTEERALIIKQRPSL
jgi:acyl-CoA reductase-like NAD-dependent aldehyde dehydrogenase